MPSVHNLLRLYMTIPITSSTSNILCSSKRINLPSLSDDKKRLNNCRLLHVHKTLTDNLDLTAVLFISQHDDASNISEILLLINYYFL